MLFSSYRHSWIDITECRVASPTWKGNMTPQKAARSQVAVTMVTNREQVVQVSKAVQVAMQLGQNPTMNRATLMKLRKRYKTKIAG